MARILTLTLNPALDLTVRLQSLQPGALNRSLGQSSHAAGKGLNVAQVLADLGHKVTVGGFLGAANAGPFEALFARRGFIDAFVRVPGETRSNIKLAEQDGRITDLNGPGPQVEARHQAELLERLEQIAAGHDAVVVAGSLPQGVSPEWFAGLLRRLKALGLPLVLDSSGAALRAGLAVGPWLIKPNAEELAEACELPSETGAELHAAALRLRGQGKKVCSAGQQLTIRINRSEKVSIMIRSVVLYRIAQVSNPHGLGFFLQGGFRVTAFAKSIGISEQRKDKLLN